MHDPWARSSAAYGNFMHGPSAGSGRTGTFSQTMPRGPAPALAQHRGLQLMGSTGNRFGGPLARTGSLPTLATHLRPRTSGPGAISTPVRVLGPQSRLSTAAPRGALAGAPPRGLLAGARRYRASDNAALRTSSSLGALQPGAYAPKGRLSAGLSTAVAGGRLGTPSRFGLPPPEGGRNASTPGAPALHAEGDRPGSPARAPTPARKLYLQAAAGPSPLAPGGRAQPPPNFKVDVAASTIQGSHPGKAANQDKFLIELPQQGGASGGSAVVGVFDGHGELGHRVSAFVTEKLRLELLGTAEEAGVVSGQSLMRKLAGSFERTNRALAASGIDVRHSGTTACTLQMAGDELIVANVGDSRAVIGRLEPGGKQGQLLVRDLSLDHKPDSDAEHRRITRSGGRVQPMHVPGALKLPFRFGLATSRAFGDTTHSPANGGQVIAEPDVTIHRLTEHDRYVVLATDGVWDVLSSHEAVAIAAHHGSDIKAATDAIAKEAKRRWELTSPVRDDITAVVMRIDPLSPRRKDESAEPRG
ncbi:phosphatase 2C-like domain-containing protein [Pavlovales sp. CCMP2436]|nr:phosphatase 2C-like domain-containing protein [Pavlovales sp. CCMP2436]